jgi:hypothetical protein
MSMSTRTIAILALIAATAVGGLAPCRQATAQSRTESRDKPRHHRTESREQPPRPAARPQARPEGRPAPDWRVRYPPVGRSVRVLPRFTESFRVGGFDYRYYSGVFYRLGGPGLYVVVRAPLGARVRHLPIGYVSFFIGPRRYFYSNFTYYWWDPTVSEYVVVAPPEGADQAVAEASSKQGSSDLFVYPKEGQSDEQRDRDRYECYVWASDQTGFDPTAENPDADKASDYRRAMSACLEGRGYTVK